MSVLLLFDDSLDRLRRGYGQPDRERRTDPDRARNFEPPAMPVEDVLDDGQAQPGAAQLPRSGVVDAIETFGQARQMLAWDALSLIAHGDPRKPAAGTIRRNPHRALRLPVFDRIVDQ